MRKIYDMYAQMYKLYAQNQYDSLMNGTFWVEKMLNHVPGS